MIPLILRQPSSNPIANGFAPLCIGNKKNDNRICFATKQLVEIQAAFLYPVCFRNVSTVRPIGRTNLQYTSKHRLCDTTRQLVRGNSPETPKQMEE